MDTGDAAVLGRRARARRLLLGLTQEHVAEKTGLSRETIRSLERGKRVQWGTAQRVAEVLDTTITGLLAPPAPDDLSPAVESLVTAASRLPGDSVELLTTVAMKMRDVTELDQAPTTRVIDSPARADTDAIDSDAKWALLTEDEKALALEVDSVRAALAERMPHLPPGGSDDRDEQVRRSRPKRRRSG